MAKFKSYKGKRVSFNKSVFVFQSDEIETDDQSLIDVLRKAKEVTEAEEVKPKKTVKTKAPE